MFQRFFKNSNNIRNILIWWGSLKKGGGATIGDFHAIQNLSTSLSEQGFEHEILSSKKLQIPDHHYIKQLKDIKTQYNNIIFVCGPVVWNEQIINFLNKNIKACKFAVGVSILSNQTEMKKIYDHIISREDGSETSYDFAPAGFPLEFPENINNESNKVGICLRGPQSEYGNEENIKSEKISDISLKLVSELGYEPVFIDTKIGLNNTISNIISNFKSSRFIITTRMHGTLYSLLYGKPVIAIDQIPGGAKVSNLVGKLNYPHLYKVENIDSSTLKNSIKEIQSPSFISDVVQYRETAIQKSRAAVKEASSYIIKNAI